VEGYDTRARSFTRSEGRLRVPGQEKPSERARRVVSNFVEVLGWVSLVDRSGRACVCVQKQISSWPRHREEEDDDVDGNGRGDCTAKRSGARENLDEPFYLIH